MVELRVFRQLKPCSRVKNYPKSFHLRRVWHADRGRLLLRTPGPVPLGLEYVQLVETNPFPNLSLFYRTMLFEYPSVLSRFCSIL